VVFHNRITVGDRKLLAVTTTLAIAPAAVMRMVVMVRLPFVGVSGLQVQPELFLGSHHHHLTEDEH
jgi:hypothetical protein